MPGAPPPGANLDEAIRAIVHVERRNHRHLGSTLAIGRDRKFMSANRTEEIKYLPIKNSVAQPRKTRMVSPQGGNVELVEFAVPQLLPGVPPTELGSRLALDQDPDNEQDRSTLRIEASRNDDLTMPSHAIAALTVRFSFSNLQLPPVNWTNFHHFLSSLSGASCAHSFSLPEIVAKLSQLFRKDKTLLKRKLTASSGQFIFNLERLKTPRPPVASNNINKNKNLFNHSNDILNYLKYFVKSSQKFLGKI
ncbi:MAG: hypothetical protein ACOZAG_00300 [Patescibacteria group bacterium]